jgi:plasmid stabilization system protein ParE
MELKINFTGRAGSDLDEIKAYLMAVDSAAAERVRDSIEQAINTMSFFPGIGRPTNTEGVCMLPVVRYPYRIYHTVSTDTVTILHIRHTSRDISEKSEL